VVFVSLVESLDLPQRVFNVGDVDQGSGLEVISGVDLEVVPVRPLASRTIAVVRVVLDWEISACCPVKIGQANHLLELRELANRKIRDGQFNAGVGLLEPWPAGDGAGCQENGTGQKVTRLNHIVGVGDM
jgi:hypothetical protein